MQTRNGFSLLEISIVLVIGGLLVVSALEAYTIYSKKQKIEKMAYLMVNIDQALQDYSVAEGRLPCPAPINGNTSGNDFNREECGTIHGITHVSGTGGQNVFIGKIPTTTLEISNDYMRDAYDNYFLYAVSENSTINTKGAVTGAIKVIEEGIDRNENSSTYGHLTPLNTHENVIYAILSVGQNGTGAFSHDGKQSIACPADSKEGNNCNNDSEFIFSLLSEGSHADFYDDHIIYKNNLASQSDIPTVLIPIHADDIEIVQNGTHLIRRMNTDGYLVVNDTTFLGTDSYATLDVPLGTGYTIGKSGGGISHKIFPYSAGDIISAKRREGSGYPINASINSDPIIEWPPHIGGDVSIANDITNETFIASSLGGTTFSESIASPISSGNNIKKVSWAFYKTE